VGRRAFISYSHVDKRLAIALERALVGIARPWRRADRITVFRDETTLRLDEPMPASIGRELERADRLVLVVSPDSARSGWVAREIDEFLASHDPTSVLLVLAEGTLVWDDDRRRFDDTSPLPNRLLTAYRELPMWADFSWRRRDVPLTLGNERFRAEVAKIAAPLRDRSPGDLIRVQRRRPWWRAVAAVGSAIALAGAGVGAIAIKRIFEEPVPRCSPAPRPGPSEPALLEASMVRISDAQLHPGAPYAVEQLHDALIRYRSPTEVLLLGRRVDPSITITFAKYQTDHARHRVPSDRMILRERVGPDGTPGRLFLATGGVVYPVLVADSLRAIGLDPTDVLEVPNHAFAHEDYLPRPGTLLRIHGSRDVWRVDNGITRTRVTGCTPSDVVELPASPHILDRVPRSAIDRKTPLAPEPGAQRVPTTNASPELTVQRCDWDHQRQVAHVEADLHNVSSIAVRYAVKVRIFSEQGAQAAATAGWAQVDIAKPGQHVSYEQTWIGKSSMSTPACRFFVDYRPVASDSGNSG
jgi:hypothetical protein